MKRRGRIWPVAVVCALAVTVAANGVMLWASSGRNAAAIEPDYYRKAVAWDSILAVRRHSAELGWTIDAALEDADASGCDLRVRLADVRGRGLDGADVRVLAFGNAAGTPPVAGSFTTGADGRASVRLPLAHRGLWELRFDVRRQDERFATTLRREWDAAFAEARP